MEIPRELKEKAVGRQQFKYNGQVVYEWEQDLNEVILYFKPPEWALPKNLREMRKNLQPGQVLPELFVEIERDRIKVGVRPNPPFMDEELWGLVVKKDSLWMIEDDELIVNLQKMRKGETWASACKRHGGLDAFSQTEVQKRIMLERFQEEHPGFDFSQAEFNGSVPDPRSFMGGVSYK
jgi:hypothetical protein